MPHDTITPDVIAHVSNVQADRLGNLAMLLEHQHAIPSYLGLRSIYDDAPNSSTKQWTIPQDRLWRIISMRIRMQSTAIAGNRSMLVDIQDRNGNVVGGNTLRPLFNVAAIRVWYVHPGVTRIDPGATLPGGASYPPDLWLPEGYTLHIFDENAIDVTGDDLIVGFLFQEITA